MSESNREPTPKTLYRPAWSDVAARMGWKWISVAPPLALIACLALTPRLFWYVLLSKIGWMIFALPFIAFAKTAADMIKSRPEPFCIGCGYDLTGLPDGHFCPECGRECKLHEIDAYRRDPKRYAELTSIQQSRNAQEPAFIALPRKRPKSRDGVS